MSDRHLPFWPADQPRHLSVPQTSLFYNAEVSATRFPDKPFILYYDTPVTFAEFRDEAERIAGFLERECGVRKGDRVLLFMQNSPQFMIGYYGILRANAVVVPVNPMNLTAELRHYVEDTGASTAIVSQELLDQMRPLMGLGAGGGLRNILVAAYSDYLKQPTDFPVPDFASAPRQALSGAGITAWSAALELGARPGPLATGPDDLCVMPYTSGTTGNPKGCMHTHRSAMYNAIAGMQWYGVRQDSVGLSVLPFFHVTGMQGGMNGPLFAGSTVVLLSRWDRDAAVRAVARYRINSLHLITTMVIDFLSHPDLAQYDLSSVNRVSGGGAAMPEAVAHKMADTLGLQYLEGYGMSETIAPTHMNPPRRPKKQCLGIPIYDVDARVVDPQTMHEMPPGETGEIIVHGPQVMQGYWNNPQATADSFVKLDGKRFLRTGDLAMSDDEGYFFMVDRLKRMINASGFKVWPAEVEALMHRHPAIREACIIATADPRRGESVKAAVVLKPEFRDSTSAQDIIDWARANMAAYKCPRSVEFFDALPRSASGKVQWRALQEREAGLAQAQARAGTGDGGAMQDGGRNSGQNSGQDSGQDSKQKEKPNAV